MDTQEPRRLATGRSASSAGIGVMSAFARGLGRSARDVQVSAWHGESLNNAKANAGGSQPLCGQKRILSSESGEGQCGVSANLTRPEVSTTVTRTCPGVLVPPICPVLGRLQGKHEDERRVATRPTATTTCQRQDVGFVRHASTFHSDDQIRRALRPRKPWGFFMPLLENTLLDQTITSPDQIIHEQTIMDHFDQHRLLPTTRARLVLVGPTSGRP